jgi:hypothetical protein
MEYGMIQKERYASHAIRTRMHGLTAEEEWVSAAIAIIKAHEKIL